MSPLVVMPPSNGEPEGQSSCFEQSRSCRAVHSAFAPLYEMLAREPRLKIEGSGAGNIGGGAGGGGDGGGEDERQMYGRASPQLDVPYMSSHWPASAVPQRPDQKPAQSSSPP